MRSTSTPLRQGRERETYMTISDTSEGGLLKYRLKNRDISSQTFRDVLAKKLRLCLGEFVLA